MAKFTLKLKCDNAAFTDDEPMQEIGRILAVLGASMRNDLAEPTGKLRDVNGNTVGEYEYRA